MAEFNVSSVNRFLAADCASKWCICCGVGGFSDAPSVTLNNPVGSMMNVPCVLWMHFEFVGMSKIGTEPRGLLKSTGVDWWNPMVLSCNDMSRFGRACAPWIGDGCC